MYYNKFNDEISLSALGLGTMRLPTLGSPGEIDKEKAREIIEYAYAHGINYFDTAYRYHDGEAEKFAGEVLSQYPRDSYYLASKLPGHQMTFKDGKLGFSGYLSYLKVDSIADVFEDQLKKCGVDYFDFYLLHNVNESSIEFYMNDEVGVVPYLMEQKRLGKIRHLGFSSHGSAETIAKMLDKYGCFEFVQIQLNYFDWSLQDAKSKYEMLEKRGIPVMVMESCRGGALATQNPKAQELMRAREPELSDASWAFRFLRSLPGVCVALSGMTTLEVLKENLSTFEDTPVLTDEEKEFLTKDIVATMADIIPCTKCRYCTDVCTQSLNIPNIISLYNETSYAGGPTMNVRVLLKGLGEGCQPSDCVGCGECKKVCPQGIDIPSIMEKFVALLEKPMARG